MASTSTWRPPLRRVHVAGRPRLRPCAKDDVAAPAVRDDATRRRLATTAWLVLVPVADAVRDATVLLRLDSVTAVDRDGLLRVIATCPGATHVRRRVRARLCRAGVDAIARTAARPAVHRATPRVAGATPATAVSRPAAVEAIHAATRPRPAAVVDVVCRVTAASRLAVAAASPDRAVSIADAVIRGATHLRRAVAVAVAPATAAAPAEVEDVKLGPIAV